MCVRVLNIIQPCIIKVPTNLVPNPIHPKKLIALTPYRLADEVNMKSYCSREPRRLSELVRNKFIQLKEIAPKAAVLNRVNINGDTQLDSGTDTADEDKTTCIPEPLSSLFECRTINFNARELKNCLRNVHFDNLSKIVKDQSLSRSWKAHRVGRIISSLQKQPFQLTNIHLQSLLLQILCNTTLLLEVKLLIMTKTWTNMPENHFKHFLENFIEIAKLKKLVFM